MFKKIFKWNYTKIFIFLKKKSLPVIAIKRDLDSITIEYEGYEVFSCELKLYNLILIIYFVYLITEKEAWAS
jgi:hypothetical protein